MNLSEKDVSDMIALYDAGISQRRIGDAFGISGQAVGKRLRSLGIETCAGGYCMKRSRITERHAKIVELYAKGISISAIARLMYMSPSDVKYVVSRAST